MKDQNDLRRRLREADAATDGQLSHAERETMRQAVVRAAAGRPRASNSPWALRLAGALAVVVVAVALRSFTWRERASGVAGPGSTRIVFIAPAGTRIIWLPPASPSKEVKS